MKKVILAILIVATKEKTNADITISAKGGHVSMLGAVELENQEGPLTLKLWRAGDSSALTIEPNECDLSVNQAESGKYEIAVGGVCITFRDTFKQDPFTVNTAANG